MITITSEGLKTPRVASLKVRITVVVMTTVTRINKVAPKVRASSLRMEEWNNMGAIGKVQL